MKRSFETSETQTETLTNAEKRLKRLVPIMAGFAIASIIIGQAINNENHKHNTAAVLNKSTSMHDKSIENLQSAAIKTANPDTILRVVTIDKGETLYGEALQASKDLALFNDNPEQSTGSILASSVEHTKNQIQLGDSFALVEYTNDAGNQEIIVQNAPKGYTEDSGQLETRSQ